MMTNSQKESVSKWTKYLSRNVLFGILGSIIVLFLFTNVFGNKEVAPDEMVTQIEEEFNGNVSVYYDEAADTYELTISNEEFKRDIMNLLIYNEDIEGWRELTESLTEYSDTLEENTGSTSYMMLMNPEYPELYIALVQDGYLVYDFTMDSY